MVANSTIVNFENFVAIKTKVITTFALLGHGVVWSFAIRTTQHIVFDLARCALETGNVHLSNSVHHVVYATALATNTQTEVGFAFPTFVVLPENEIVFFVETRVSATGAVDVLERFRAF